MSVPAQRVTEPLSALDRPHLADTTVWSKIQPHEALARWFNEEVRAGRILTCDVVALELLRSARNTDTFRTQSRLLGLLEHCPTGLDEHARAREVQRSLAEQGRHRGIPPADLLIAAAAEAVNVPLLHYDHDYDLIAEVTDQPVRWFVPAGSLP
ncbi:MAG: PIN domain-containing protein [Actinomycetota bacterium]|nr:PIN domain-containing protein [Actinomycetota bacterium]